MPRKVLGALALVAAALVFLPVSGTPGASVATAAPANGVYIVQLVEPPAVAYDGGIAGLAATKPAAGSKLDPLSGAVTKYAGYLRTRHDSVLAKVGGSKLYDYVYSYDGFAAKLDPHAAAILAKQSGVAAVTPDELQTVDTSNTPTFLGLTDPNGLWAQLGGPVGGKNVNGAGEGMIIGDIDSGIWPESASFSDRDASGKLVFQQIPGWHGKCAPGEEFVGSDCSQKLIGAQWFDASWGGDAGLKAQRPWEFASARDYNGHGSHTASTAAGDYGVTPGAAAAFGKISGIAPRARIAMYKALWSTEDGSTASGATSDLVAAIDQAVRDGVDVINYSVSGTSTNFGDPVEVAFLFAADAGVFVSTSAGNSGPTASTVAHPSPWVTTVAAGTHNRSTFGTLHLGNGTSYTGISTALAGAGPAPLVNSTAVGLAGADATAVRLCFDTADNGGTPVLDPAKVAGKIVVCERGSNARVAKSLAVKEAGGVGMVLVNTSSAQSLNADFHSVPTVHLPSTNRAAVEAYAAVAGATATIDAAVVDLLTPAPFTAAFSSRGPLLAGRGDLLKPDVIAPGQDILAAVAPPGNGGLSFNLYSGTSMSAPHVAGLALLLMQKHPDWSPMAVKSALMTSAYDVLDGPDTDPAVIFSQGAGHVKPNSAVDPGLVYDSAWSDWLAFLCGTTTLVDPAYCSGLPTAAKDVSNMNVPSIAIGDLAGTQTVTRRVTNVGSQPATYVASTSGLAGLGVVVTPGTLTLAAGQTKSFDVTFTRTDATLNAYTGGYLTWTSAPHVVRIPVVIEPVALAAPAQVSASYSVTFGYTGPFTATARGLIPATTFAGSVTTDPDGTFHPGEGTDTASFDVTVPPGSTYARFSLFDSTTSPASDLDLYVYKGGTQVGSSGGGTSAEEVDLLNPAAGTYTVWVHGFATGNPSTFTLFAWALGPASAGNMTVTAPATATTGGTGSIGLSFTGLTTGTKYLGSVVYGGSTGMPNPTIVRVDP